MRLKKDKDIKELKQFGFKYGPRDTIVYKTKYHGIESRIYIDLIPCHNNNNEIKVECPSHTIPDKILNKLYDIIEAGLVEK